MKKNFLITTGGSGGHVIPATILYDHLSKKNNVIISTDMRGLKFLDKEIYPFKIIDTPKLSNILLLPFNFFVILFLTFKSLFLLKNEEIDNIISTGGYMSLPIILAARLSKKNIYLLEPNLVLGRANKFFLKFCKKIFCYKKEIKNFPDNYKDKVIIINPLVKEYIYKAKQLSDIKIKHTLLIVGGSQGAKIFDNNLKNSIVQISKKIPLKIIQQTNKKNISFLKKFYLDNKVENKIFSFERNFGSFINQVDLCITRAGASTLAELSVLNIPFIAVPLPQSKDNHQFENANFYKKNDCCWLIEQNLFEEKIEELLKDIFENKTDYNKKKKNLENLNYQNTWNNVNQKILSNMNEN